MSTIILSAQLKVKILLDMAEFLNEATARWYTRRGLPYRRGYLFSGAPGTGKTSISFAIAGVFRLPIYVLSLQDPTISENDLMILFTHLPEKCVMILEDIDSAGIRNRGKAIQTQGPHRLDSDRKDAVDQETDSRISLSGLLNVIDGIASTEGRILIMTTNSVITLDPALIRPGRIDMIIDFELLDRSGAKDLFNLMYRDSASTIEHTTTKVIDQAELKDLAERFAKQMPEKVFSPAEVQGYLLLEKHNPQNAVKGFQTWISKTQEQKKAEEHKRTEVE